MRAALYARFSTDLQRLTSIDDQLRMARARAIADGHEVVAEFSDDGVSGSMPIESRPGSRALMDLAADGGFDVLVIEALDRFSRDVVDQERMVRRLEHHLIAIVGVVDGYSSSFEGREMYRVMRGAMNQQLLRDIAKKTHRGLAGQISRGFHAGGISYGYKSVVVGVDARGEPIGHRLEVDPEPARWVRWIFEQFAEGQSAQAIAHELNRLGIPSTRGSTWAVSAIFGARLKGSGILNNEIYIGRYIWNRSKWVKNPDTGRRQRLDRPEAEWITAERPELRIIDDALWGRVRARMDRPRLAGGTQGKGQQPRTLFGGLMACGLCGGAMIAINAWSYGCAARKDRGPSVCAGVSAPRKAVDARLLTAAREDLLSPESMVEFHARVAQVVAERDRLQGGDAGKVRARLVELAGEIERLVDAVVKSGHSPAIQKRLQAAEEEQARLRGQIAAWKPGKVVSAASLAKYRQKVLELQAALQADAMRAREALRELLGPIRIVPAANGEIYAEFEAQPQQLMAAGGASLGMVAGTRFTTQKRIRIT